MAYWCCDFIVNQSKAYLTNCLAPSYDSRRHDGVLLFQRANRSWVLIGWIEQDGPVHGVGGLLNLSTLRHFLSKQLELFLYIVLYFFIDVFLYYGHVLSHHVAPVLEQHHYMQLCIFVYLYLRSSNSGVPCFQHKWRWNVLIMTEYCIPSSHTFTFEVHSHQSILHKIIVTLS